MGALVYQWHRYSRGQGARPVDTTAVRMKLRARGHSLLRAATDTEIEITAEGRTASRASQTARTRLQRGIRVHPAGRGTQQPTQQTVTSPSWTTPAEVQPRQDAAGRAQEARLRCAGGRHRDERSCPGMRGYPSGYPSFPRSGGGIGSTTWRCLVRNRTPEKTFRARLGNLVNAPKVVGMAGGRCGSLWRSRRTKPMRKYMSPNGT